MTTTRAVCACLLLITPAIAGAQSDDELIAEALSPLPEYLRDGATVTSRDDNGDRRVLQEGTSGLSCSPDGPGPGFLVSCIDDSSGPVLQEFRRHLALGRSPREAMDAVTTAARRGTVATATPGGMIWILSGASRSDLVPMVGTLVPFATGESTGLPEEPTPNRAWLMCPGTPRAHIMVVRLPGATEESTGLATEPSADRAWLMFPGTHQAHMMIGSPPYGWSRNK